MCDHCDRIEKLQELLDERDYKLVKLQSQLDQAIKVNNQLNERIFQLKDIYNKILDSIIIKGSTSAI